MKSLDTLINAGFKPRKPLNERSRQKLFDSLDQHVPKSVRSFYEFCNGGRFAKAEVRAYPLAEAVELIKHYDWFQDFAIFPIFVAENDESDPCMVICSKQLRGYVYFHSHDGSSRVLAPSLSAFVRSLVKHELQADFFLFEDSEFVFPRELAGQDKRHLSAIIDGSLKSEFSEADKSHLRGLAESMVLGKHQKRVFRPLNSQADTFLDHCVATLLGAGIPAKRDAIYGIVIGPQNVPWNWEIFIGDWKEPDFDREFIEGIREDADYFHLNES